MTEETQDIRALAGSIGILIDRSLARDEVLGTVWLLEQHRAAGCAHGLAMYAGNYDALLVRFPAVNEERCVSKVAFHPRFNRKLTQRIARETISDAQPVLSLQRYNAAVLTLSPVAPLSLDRKHEINKALMAPISAKEQALTGDLSEIDLSLVIQTITNARKQGTILISDERYRPFANIFCSGGRVTQAQFKNLFNEMALYQIFENPLSGHFIFKSTDEPEFFTTRQITRPVDMLLIEAHRRMDELEKMTTQIGGRDALFRQAVDHPDFGILADETRECAAELWQFLDGTIRLGDLWKLVDVDDYTVFSAIADLFKTRQVEDIAHGGSFLTAERHIDALASKMKMEPLPVAMQFPLSPRDSLESLSVESRTGRPRAREGLLLGALREGDPYHLVHNVRMPPDATGAPLIKSGCVIGMHCGNLPQDPEAIQGTHGLQQMLWIEAIIELLDNSGDEELARKLKTTGEEMVRRLTRETNIVPSASAQPAGCREVARVDCPKCGATSLESARFCKKCGSQLLADFESRLEGKKRRSPTVPVAAIVACLLIAVCAGVASMARIPIPQPHTVQNAAAVLPDEPWVKIDLHRFDVSTRSWPAVAPGTMMKKTDRIYIDVTAQEPCFVYLLDRATTSDRAVLIFPNVGVANSMLESGSRFTYPEKYEQKQSNGQVSIEGLTFEGPRGTDSLVAIGSHTKLDLSDPTLADNAFQSAKTMLDSGVGAQGLETAASNLAPALPEDQVFISKFTIRHGDE